jgi:modification methylase
MKTIHRTYFKNSNHMDKLSDESVDLVVTSPPYPMIEMWDDSFIRANPEIKKAFQKYDGNYAFKLMHQELDAVWDEVIRVLRPGGFCCINIGDATRTIKDNFVLYPNHGRILSYLYQKGLTPLPAVLWRKQTNAPNKFMGSGMLPAGAYVTLEHEYILIARKGNKREFLTETKKRNRQQSAIFWEERNQWFSDVWMDLKGTRQKLTENSARNRSAAFPFDVPFRLINMFSVKGDTVLDPFLGVGTTLLAAMSLCRNSIGYEIQKDFKELIIQQADAIVDISNQLIRNRLLAHREFVQQRIAAQKPLKHINGYYHFPVVTNQEKNLLFNPLIQINQTGNLEFEVMYDDKPQPEFCRWDAHDRFSRDKEKEEIVKPDCVKPQVQRKLFEEF